MFSEEPKVYTENPYWGPQAHMLTLPAHLPPPFRPHFPVLSSISGYPEWSVHPIRFQLSVKEPQD